MLTSVVWVANLVELVPCQAPARVVVRGLDGDSCTPVDLCESPDIQKPLARAFSKPERNRVTTKRIIFFKTKTSKLKC